MKRYAWIVASLAACTALSGCGRREEPRDERSASESDAPRAVDEGNVGRSTIQPADTAGVDSVLGLEQPVLDYLVRFVGSTPVESRLWQSQPLAPILYKVLGSRFETLLVNMQEADPIAEQNGIVYVTGHKKYGEDKAALVVDTKTDAIYVWLLVGGEAEEYQWGDSVVLPEPVLQLVEPASPMP